jgi:divalent metal cation (Fe/Co/Zn/Cd) transporter
MTYGWKRVEIVGALMNAVFLLALCFYIVLEAIPRLIRPPPVFNNNTFSFNDTMNETSPNNCDSESLVGDWWYLGIAITMLAVNLFSAIVFAGIFQF